jgi:integrase/recombinase XerD
MIRRRARQAGVETKIGCHTFRATGITIYLTNGGDLDREYLDAYIEAAGLWEDKKGPLFRATNGKTGVLSARPLDREDAFHMIRRRAAKAGIETKIGNHTFRATGITIYLTNGGDLEKAQQMAAHESPRTTKLYDRRNDVVSLDEVEKVVF